MSFDFTHYLLSPLSSISSILQMQGLTRKIDAEKNNHALQKISLIKARVELLQWYLDTRGKKIEDFDLSHTRYAHELVPKLFSGKIITAITNEATGQTSFTFDSKTTLSNDDLTALHLLNSIIENLSTCSQSHGLIG